MAKGRQLGSTWKNLAFKGKRDRVDHLIPSSRSQYGVFVQRAPGMRQCCVGAEAAVAESVGN